MLRPMLTCALLAVATLGLGACTGHSPAEHASLCPTVDWREYGRNDGELGVPAGKRDDFLARCRELGHPPDLEAYREGRAEGLAGYCTAESGYQAGRTGRGYHDVCPPEREVAFLQGYEEGREERGYRHYPRYRIGFGYFRGHHHGFFGHRFGYGFGHYHGFLGHGFGHHHW